MLEWEEFDEEAPQQESRADLSDDGELTPEEEAFMQGYDDADEIDNAPKDEADLEDIE